MPDDAHEAGERRLRGDPPAVERYGAAWAEVYDELHRHLDTADAVAALARLAGGGPVAEFGAGTGRLALPLAARGLRVHAVEASAEMIACLRAKPGAEALTVTRADFTHVRLAERFALVVLAFNTLLAQPTPATQARALASAAAHLRAGGRVVVEAAVVPAGAAPRRLPGEPVPDVVIERLDPDTGALHALHAHVAGGRLRFLPISVRCTSPEEIDDLAAAAGLALDDRRGDWEGGPFTATSARHVSVYRAG